MIKQQYQTNYSRNSGGLTGKRWQCFLLLPLNGLQFNKHGKDKINTNMQIQIIILYSCNQNQILAILFFPPLIFKLKLALKLTAIRYTKELSSWGSAVKLRKAIPGKGIIVTAGISFCVVPDPFLNALFVLFCYLIITH